MTAELPLNWQDDPIYFDSEARSVTEWLNANELVNNNRINDIFLEDKKTLNLYPLMVRRSDFIREKSADRILARFPYVQLTAEEKAIITSQELLIAEKLRDYFYKSDNRRILEWRDILQKDLERGFVPLPFLRCFPEELKVDFHNRSFESARGEAFTMPLQLTDEIAYLSGMVNGDGSLKKYVLLIVDYSIENIRQLKEQFQRLFDQTGRIQLQTENSPTLIITNLWVVRFFSFLTSQPIGGKKYHALREPLIFLEPNFRSSYWSGVMDADGSYVGRNIVFTSASKDYSLDFITFLKSLKIPAKLLTRSDDTYQVYISRKFHDIYKRHIVCLHPEKKIKFSKLKKGTSKTYSQKTRKKFISFNKEKLIGNFFDFNFLNGIQIIGLGNFIRSERGSKTLKFYSKRFDVSDSYLSLVENEKSALAIDLLKKILQSKNKDLMPFLLIHKQNILFRKGKSKPIKLDLIPTKELQYLASKMTFHTASISFPIENQIIHNKIREHFGITIKKNRIENGLLHYYFAIFCIFE